MKNLILSIGIVILMMMELLFQADCMDVIRMERKLKWIGEEIAWITAEELWGGEAEENFQHAEETKSDEEQKMRTRLLIEEKERAVDLKERANQIERLAKTILKENLKLDENLFPADQTGILSQQFTLEVDWSYPCVRVALDGGRPKTRLPFLAQDSELRKIVSYTYTFAY